MRGARMRLLQPSAFVYVDPRCGARLFAPFVSGERLGGVVTVGDSLRRIAATVVAPGAVATTKLEGTPCASP